jgi:hypothetical protein
VLDLVELALGITHDPTGLAHVVQQFSQLKHGELPLCHLTLCGHGLLLLVREVEPNDLSYLTWTY